MCTEVTSDGAATITRQDSKPGDYVEFLALMDVLAVPNVCGADVMATSNFELKPLKLVVYEATEEDLALVPEVPRYRNQRTPADFKVKEIKADRALRRDPSYRPDFTNVPLMVSELEVRLDDEEAEMLERLKTTARSGKTDGEALRAAFFAWWIANFMHGPKHFRSG